MNSKNRPRLHRSDSCSVHGLNGHPRHAQCGDPRTNPVQIRQVRCVYHVRYNVAPQAGRLDARAGASAGRAFGPFVPTAGSVSRGRDAGYLTCGSGAFDPPIRGPSARPAEAPTWASSGGSVGGPFGSGGRSGQSWTGLPEDSELRSRLLRNWPISTVKVLWNGLDGVVEPDRVAGTSGALH